MWMLPTNKSLLYALGIGLTLAGVYGAGYTHARRINRGEIAQLQQRHPDIARVALRQMMGNERFKSLLNAAQLAWVLKLLKG